MTSPRATDDFAMIQARLDELRRERASVAAERAGHGPDAVNEGPDAAAGSTISDPGHTAAEAPPPLAPVEFRQGLNCPAAAERW
jgi:hypothetical protein